MNGEDQLISGKYRVLDLVAREEFASLFEVEEAQSHDVHRIKVFDHLLASQAQVLRQEIDTLRGLDHPGLVDIRSSGILPDGRVYLLQEKFDGRPLSEVLREGGSLPRQTVIGMFCQLAGALAHAEERGVVLRSVLPWNILIDPAKGAKLLAFAPLTKVSQMVEQRHAIAIEEPFESTERPYRSPEEQDGASPDVRSSIYSLGMVMFQAVAGRLPVGASGIDRTEVPGTDLVQRRSDNGRDGGKSAESKCAADDSRSKCESESPQRERLAAVLDKCIAGSPDQRYQSARDLCRDLERLIAGQEPESMKFRPTNTSYRTGDVWRRGSGSRQYGSHEFWNVVITVLIFGAMFIVVGSIARRLSGIAAADSFEAPSLGPSTRAKTMWEGVSPLPALRHAEELDYAGKQEAAEQLYKSAEAKAMRMSDARVAANALVRLAHVRWKKQQLVKAKELALRAARIAATSNETRALETEAKCTVVMILAQEGHADEAEAMLAKGAGSAETPRQKFLTENASAFVAWKKKEILKARIAIRRALEQFDRADEKDPVVLAQLMQTAEQVLEMAGEPGNIKEIRDKYAGILEPLSAESKELQEEVPNTQ